MIFPFLALPAIGDPIKLLAFGDSLVHGYGLPKDEGFVPQLEAWLRDNGREVEVINAGVSGETTAGGLARLDWTLAQEVDAVYVSLGGNDLLRGVPAASVEDNLAQIVAKVRDKGLPVMVQGYRATPNFGPDYQEAFNAAFARVGDEEGVLFHPYVFQGIARAMEAGEIDRDGAFQADGIHPNARGVALNVAAIGPVVLELLDQVPAR